MALNNKICENAKAGKAQIKLVDGGGVYFQVMRSGAILKRFCLEDIKSL